MRFCPEMPDAAGCVVLVDSEDRALGMAEKLYVHQEGLLHRAFSVFLFNDEGEWLLQRRSLSKYHSAGLWSNACCSHPRPGETVEAAARRRLEEELGVAADLRPAFRFTYRAKLPESGLIEAEVDHILTGRSNEVPRHDPTEVADYRWVSAGAIEEHLRDKPRDFTVWFRLLFGRVRRSAEFASTALPVDS